MVEQDGLEPSGGLPPAPYWGKGISLALCFSFPLRMSTRRCFGQTA